MNFNLPKNIYFFIIGIIALLVVLLSVIFLPRKSPQLINVGPSSSPTQKPLYLDPGYNGPPPESIFQTSTPESEESARRSKLVGLLLKKLPYSGTKFSLRYNMDTNQFIAVYADGEEAAGKIELDGFLESNGIDSTSWLNNFTVQRGLY